MTNPRPVDLDSHEIPKRLGALLVDGEFEARVQWMQLQISLFGSEHIGKRLPKRYSDEFLVTVIMSHSRDAAEAAQFYEFEDLAILTRKVLQSDDIYSWKALAVARPEMADSIQSSLIEKWNKQIVGDHDQGLNTHFFEDFLKLTQNTNPVPVQALFVARGGGLGDLVDMTIRLPKRTSLFATVALILSKSAIGAERFMEQLCKARPEAIPVVQECILHEVYHGYDTCASVCQKVHGLDLDAIEQFILAKWDKWGQQEFCNRVKRERGPCRDILTIAHVMES